MRISGPCSSRGRIVRASWRGWTWHRAWERRTDEETRAAAGRQDRLVALAGVEHALELELRETAGADQIAPCGEPVGRIGQRGQRDGREEDRLRDLARVGLSDLQRRVVRRCSFGGGRAVRVGAKPGGGHYDGGGMASWAPTEYRGTPPGIITGLHSLRSRVLELRRRHGHTAMSRWHGWHALVVTPTFELG